MNGRTRAVFASLEIVPGFFLDACADSGHVHQNESIGNHTSNLRKRSMITGLHHTGIVVRDLPTVLPFYVDLMGMTIVGEIDSVAPPTGNHTGIPNSRRKLVFLGYGPSEEQHLVELVCYLDPPASDGHLGKHQFGASHLCFLVDDLGAEYARLVEAGVPFETSPKFSETPDGRLGVIYARDPEGNWLELIEGKVAYAKPSV